MLVLVLYSKRYPSSDVCCQSHLASSETKSGLKSLARFRYLNDLWQTKKLGFIFNLWDSIGFQNPPVIPCEEVIGYCKRPSLGFQTPTHKVLCHSCYGCAPLHKKLEEYLKLAVEILSQVGDFLSELNNFKPGI